METNHLVHLTTEQRNRLHSHLVCERERHRMAREALELMRVDQRLRELALSGLIALDRNEYAVAMELEPA